MPKNALDNPLVLPILGLLVERPRHAYAVFSELRRRYDYLRVRNATVYTLLDRLMGERWVTAENDDDRAALAVTDAGVAALAERVRRQLRSADPTGGPAFVTAFAYLGILQPTEAAAVLAQRVARIREEIHRLEHAIDGVVEPEIHMIEAHYLLSRLRHDVDWLAGAVRRIETGELGWTR